jgi:polyisoprenoid-binding protein YceI
MTISLKNYKFCFLVSLAMLSNFKVPTCKAYLVTIIYFITMSYYYSPLSWSIIMTTPFFTKSAFAALALMLATSTAQAATTTYTLDPTHTNVVWNISHFEFSTPNGKFFSPTGEVVLDDAKPENSTVKVSFDINNLTTGVAKLDEHLKTKEFFDVTAFPKAEFVSTKVAVTGKNTAHVTGNLTLHGVTKPITLAVTLNKVGENIFKMHTAGFSATGTIKRSDFGIVTYLPGLGDEVTLNIQAEGNVAAK